MAGLTFGGSGLGDIEVGKNLGGSLSKVTSLLGMGGPGLSMPGYGGSNQGGNVKVDQGVSKERSSGQTYYSDPNMAKSIVNTAGGLAQDAAGQYMNFVTNPSDNPIFQNSLSGLLGMLAPSEDAARMNLADTFRASGNTASSTFADKAVGLESEFMRNRQGLASNLLTQLFPQVTDALYKPIGQSADLTNALKLQQEQSAKDSSNQGVAVGANAGSGSGTVQPKGFHNGVLYV